jgi:alkanesulfonate monooxygenase SsuD/methylene tetrahydromethanopterin reductase-like flavin-dependent oxidoreductase (luciferase family)
VLPALFRDTTTLRIGPLVASMTLRNPTMLAAHAATVDHVSGGRLELGLGAAGAARDHGATGVAEWSRAERSERFAEWVEIVVRLLGGEELVFGGRHYGVSGARLQPGPVQDPLPVTVAAFGPKSLEVAARHAHTWNSLGYTLQGRRVTGDNEIALARSRNETLDSLCGSIGRDPASIARSYLTAFGRREPLPPVEKFEEIVRALEGAGMTDVIINWPDDERQYDALVAIAQALPELRSP